MRKYLTLPLASVGMAETEILCTCSLSGCEIAAAAAVSAGEQGDEGSPKGRRAAVRESGAPDGNINTQRDHGYVTTMAY